MFAPANSIRKFRFCNLAGVENVQLIGSNRIVGRFQADLKEFYGPSKHRLIEDFLNWRSDPKSILRFTRKYGPLRDEPVAGKEFEVFWWPWQADQKRLRSLWRRRGVFDLSEAESTGGSLALGKGWLTYRVVNLFVYLYMDLVTCEAKRLKICKRADCPNPYFIASHLKQRFCSDKCAEWGQREWKKQWWTEHGTAWRENRKKLKGDKNVTRKAR
ncbi:MAG TPA: hypothetical protein VN950_25065 [Terriglobales bacterium]|nr:hypothetical protein [Terriglobales bacterium]